MPTLQFDLETATGMSAATVPISMLIIAGWTGRDLKAVEHHIAELARLNVKPPSQVPLFYRVSSALLTQAETIEALGDQSSGEAEPVIFGERGELWLTLGSDHTDRQAEAYSVAISKQMCAKPVARKAWRLSEVLSHWDSLVLRSFITEQGKRVLYQEGTLAAMRSPADLLPRYSGAGMSLPDGTMMSCGTLVAIGGVRPAGDLSMELEDPVLHRVIRHQYSVRPLPVVS
jgi:hypothetical protein